MRLLTIVVAAASAWALVIAIALTAMLLTGCGIEDKAYPLDCPDACGHRLD